MPDVANKADLEKAIQEGLTKKPSDGQEFTEETKSSRRLISSSSKSICSRKVTQEEIDQGLKHCVKQLHN